MKGGIAMMMLTLTRRKLIRICVYSALILVGVVIGVYAVMSAIDTSAASRKVPIYSVERGDNKIAITYDVAWGNSDTQSLLTMLEELDVKVTFFVTGEWCDKYPEDVKLFAAAGHDIQNHSDKHPHVNKVGTKELIADTRDAAKKIEALTAVYPTLYRTPYGEYNDQNLTTLEGMGFKVIQFDCDSIDWRDESADKITKRVLKKVKSGSILLFHNEKANTAEALPNIVSKLREDGYEFVLVKDLIYYDEYEIDHEGRQHTTATPMD